MKIAIISDTHDNLATLAKFLDYVKINPVEAIIHCGDIAEGETLEYLAKNFAGRIYAVLGNMDYRQSVEDTAKKLSDKVTLWPDFGQPYLGYIKIGFCHHIETAKSHCGDSFDFIFYGHSHKPWKEIFGSCVLANPGNLAGLIYKATFAILETQTKKLDLFILDQI